MSDLLSLAFSTSQPASQPVLGINRDGSLALKKLEPVKFNSYVRPKPNSDLGPNTFEIVLSDEGEDLSDYDYGDSDSYDSENDSDESEAHAPSVIPVSFRAPIEGARYAPLLPPDNRRRPSIRGYGPVLHRYRTRFSITPLPTIFEDIPTSVISGRSRSTVISIDMDGYDADSEDEDFYNLEDADNWSDVDEDGVALQPGVPQQFPLDELDDFEEEHLLPDDAPFVVVPSDCSRSDQDSPTWIDRSFDVMSSSSTSSDGEEVAERVHQNENAGVLLIRRIRDEGEDARQRMNHELQMVLVERELGY